MSQRNKYIKPYWKIDNGILYHGDCFNILKKIKANSVDLIVTDPPYQLSNRVLDFPFCKDCGYETQAGFQKQGHHNFCPKCKSKNINRIRGKIKGFMGKEWDVLPSVDIWKECLRVLKPGAFAFVMSSPRQDCLCEMIKRLSEAGFNTGFTSIYWTYSSGFPKAGNVGKLVDKKMGVEGKEVPADGMYANLAKKGWNNINHKIEMPPRTTKEAKALDGSYTGYNPKPAVEIILVCMKPLSEKTYVNQALNNGKGCSWLDDCRVPYESGVSEKDVLKKYTGNNKGNQSVVGNFGVEEIKCTNPEATIQGRFPANLLVSDDVLNDNINRQSGGRNIKTNCGNSFYKVGIDQTIADRDSGSYSRYFDLDKWFAEKIKQLPEPVQKCLPFLLVAKASKGEKNKGLTEEQEPSHRPSGVAYNDKSGVHSEKQKGNIHPTAKPIKLMSYLITLGSRPGDTILDPFLGSGTTCVSADILSRKWIGIEREKEYIEIAKARIEDESNQLKLFGGHE